MPTFQPGNFCRGKFRRFAAMLSRQKGLIAVVGLLSLLITGIGIAGAFSFQFLLDHVLTNLHDEAALDSSLDTFAVLITALGGLYLVKLAVQMLRGKLLTEMSKRIDLPLMLGYSDHMSRLPMRFFDTRKTGEIMSRLNDSGKIRDAISSVTLTLMIDTLMIAVCGVILYRAGTALFSVAVITCLLYTLVSAAYLKPLETYNHELMERGAQFSSYVKETIDGMETVKTTRSEKNIMEKTASLFRAFVKCNIGGSMMGISKDALMELITSISTLALLWIGAVNIIEGTMTIGTLITFVTLLDYFLGPVKNLAELQGNLQTALVAAERLNDVWDLETERTEGITPPEEIEEISFDQVSFRYGTRQLVLDNLSFSAHRGQQIGLAGESGCGKSTVSKLLMGMYAPESGEVRINGVSTSDLSLAWLRANTAYVSQNIFLFADTIRNNLLLGLEECPSDEEISHVLHVCCCDFVWDLPFGLDSMLEENGINLSGGQRQRLAIARALLRKPNLLILDEATSALDTVTESRIQSAIREYFPGAVVLIISHRLHAVKNCDQILVLDHGQMIENGSHLELLNVRGRYADLWACQNEEVA